MASARGRVVRGAAPDHLLVLRRDASAAPVPRCFSCPPGLSRQAWVPVQISLFSFYVYAFELPEHGSVKTSFTFRRKSCVPIGDQGGSLSRSHWAEQWLEQGRGLVLFPWDKEVE